MLSSKFMLKSKCETDDLPIVAVHDAWSMCRKKRRSFGSLTVSPSTSSK
jgi:hypothetical protein